MSLKGDSFDDKSNKFLTQRTRMAHRSSANVAFDQDKKVLAANIFLKDLQNLFLKHLLQHLEAEVLGTVSIGGLDPLDLGLGHRVGEDPQHWSRWQRW